MQELGAHDARVADCYAFGPGVTLRSNMIMTADGVAAGSDGLSKSLSGPADGRLLSLLRAVADAVIVAAGTLREEHYHPIRTRPGMASYRAAAGLAEHPRLVMITTEPKRDRSLRALAQAPVRPLVLCAHDTGALADVAEVVELPDGSGRVDLVGAKALLGEIGLRRLHTEGGPRLLAQLIAGDLLDEYCLTVAPMVLGGEAQLRPVMGATTPARFALRGSATADGYVFLRYGRLP